MIEAMSEPAKVKLEAFNEEQTDWYGTCRKCGGAIRGSLKDIREHKCGSKAQ